MTQDEFEQKHKEIIQFIDLFLNSIEPENRSRFAEFIAFQAALRGSVTHYEGLGILEEAKLTYRDRSNEAFEEEDLSDITDQIIINQEDEIDPDDKIAKSIGFFGSTDNGLVN